jgi:hypothetical protein
MENITPPAKRISAKIRRAVELMADKQAKGGRMLIQDAAAAVGLCREHLGRELRKPHVVNIKIEGYTANYLSILRIVSSNFPSSTRSRGVSCGLVVSWNRKHIEKARRFTPAGLAV